MTTRATFSADLFATKHPRVFVRKVLLRTAYARNGNAHNPTKTYGWNVELKLDDGSHDTVARCLRTRAMAVEVGMEALAEFGIA